MILGLIAGTVVGSQRNDRMEGASYRLVEPCDQEGSGKGGHLVALDPMGAGPGEMVVLSQGSSARQTELSYQKPVDAIIVGIVDLIDERGQVVYRK